MVSAARKAPAAPLPTRRQARLELARRRAANDIGAFIELHGRRLDRPVHLSPLLVELDRSLRESVFALVSVPPRHGKTQTILHHMIRYLQRFPDRIVCYATYNQTRARKMSREARKIARLAGLKIGGLLAGTTDAAANSVDFWQTPEGGGFLAVGRGSALTGEGVHLLVIDDPVKGREETNSVTIRENVWEWFTGTAYIRLEPGGSCFIVHTRWHEEDLIGRVLRLVELASEEDDPELAGEAWVSINIPAVAANDNGALEALWPKRYDLAKLNRIRKTVGEHDWWSLFMGAPRPKDSKVFGDCYFYEPPANTNGRRIVIACDPAGTASTRADWSVIVVAAYWRAPIDPLDPKSDRVIWMDILEVRRRQCELPELADELHAMQSETYIGATVVVETQGGEGKATAQVLRRLNRNLKVVGIKAHLDKLQRATPASKAWNGGRIRCPRGAKWLPAYLRVVQNFTGNDRVDDDVDATAHAFNYADGSSGDVPSNEGLKKRAASDLGGY